LRREYDATPIFRGSGFGVVDCARAVPLAASDPRGAAAARPASWSIERRERTEDDEDTGTP
jgi:hypothetical protein